MKPNVNIKSVLEQVSDKVFKAKSLTEAKQIIIDFINEKKIDGEDKKTILKNTEECKTLIKLQTYLTNSLLTYEGLGLGQLNKSAKQASIDKTKDEENGY